MTTAAGPVHVTISIGVAHAAPAAPTWTPCWPAPTPPSTKQNARPQPRRHRPARLTRPVTEITGPGQTNSGSSQSVRALITPFRTQQLSVSGVLALEPLQRWSCG